jgi:HD-like signal output (HDOD) protein
MINPFRRFFPAAIPPVAIQPVTTPVVLDAPNPGIVFVEATLPAQESAPPWQAQTDINGLFFACLYSDLTSRTHTPLYFHGAPEASGVTQKNILRALDKLCNTPLTGSDLVPRVPFIVPQILKSLRDDKVSNNELAFHIAKDPVLVSQLILEVNTAYYGADRKIINLDKAVQLLGQNGLRSLVSKVAFRPIFNAQSGELGKSLIPQLWRHAEKCSLACRALARERKQNHFAGFLAGLVQHVGLIVACRVVDDHCKNSVVPMSLAFQNALLDKAGELTYRIAKEWEFPQDVLLSLRNQGYSPDQLSDLSLSFHQADQLSKIYLLVQRNQLAEDDPLLQLDQDAQIRACYSGLSGKTR